MQSTVSYKCSVQLIVGGRGATGGWELGFMGCIRVMVNIIRQKRRIVLNDCPGATVATWIVGVLFILRSPWKDISTSPQLTAWQCGFEFKWFLKPPAEVKVRVQPAPAVKHVVKRWKQIYVNV